MKNDITLGISRRSRRIKHKHDFRDDNILVIDSGCDQCMLSSMSFLVTHKSGIYYRLHRALHGMESINSLELVNACTLVTLQSGEKYIASSRSVGYQPQKSDRDFAST